VPNAYGTSAVLLSAAQCGHVAAFLNFLEGHAFAEIQSDLKFVVCGEVLFIPAMSPSSPRDASGGCKQLGEIPEFA